MIENVLTAHGDPPVNKMRKVIFKPAAWHLTLSKKLSIVGKLIGRNKLNKETLYQSMLFSTVCFIKKVTKPFSFSAMNLNIDSIYSGVSSSFKNINTKKCHFKDLYVVILALLAKHVRHKR